MFGTSIRLRFSCFAVVALGMLIEMRHADACWWCRHRHRSHYGTNQFGSSQNTGFGSSSTEVFGTMYMLPSQNDAFGSALGQQLLTRFLQELLNRRPADPSPTPTGDIARELRAINETLQTMNEKLENLDKTVNRLVTQRDLDAIPKDGQNKKKQDLKPAPGEKAGGESPAK